MVRHVAVALIFALTTTAMSTPATALSCSGAQISAGTCSVGGGTTDTGVDLWGDVTTGGSSGSADSDGPDECPVVVNGQCVGSSPPKGGGGPTTVSDLESFKPRSPQQFAEPSGWAIQRIPVNFWSNAKTHVVSGILLDNPADVRFSPVVYRRSFGDGSRQTSESPGDTWRELGQPPWTRTLTSHSYDEVGDVRVRLVVWYSAAFRFGSQRWRRLTGLVKVRANDLSISVLSADTVLVDRPCSRGAIGCPDG
ncbi:unannotated protein [freshwater metagenome]|uniref:Unannotated protein n=1 Tax=freshwater metagenome TaxID=449393 RepID=A0A6J6F1M8_9ZZZZ